MSHEPVTQPETIDISSELVRESPVSSNWWFNPLLPPSRLGNLVNHLQYLFGYNICMKAWTCVADRTFLTEALIRNQNFSRYLRQFERNAVVLGFEESESSRGKWTIATDAAGKTSVALIVEPHW